MTINAKEFERLYYRKLEEAKKHPDQLNRLGAGQYFIYSSRDNVLWYINSREDGSWMAREVGAENFNYTDPVETLKELKKQLIYQEASTNKVEQVMTEKTEKEKEEERLIKALRRVLLFPFLSQDKIYYKNLLKEVTVTKLEEVTEQYQKYWRRALKDLLEDKVILSFIDDETNEIYYELSF